jgi:hypothetical protein
MACDIAIEKKAKEHYTQVTGNSVFDNGLTVTNSQSWLCASRDSFFGGFAFAFALESNAQVPVKTQ